MLMDIHDLITIFGKLITLTLGPQVILSYLIGCNLLACEASLSHVYCSWGSSQTPSGVSRNSRLAIFLTSS